MKQRFKTQFRGAEADVEMEILHGPPEILFTIMINGESRLRDLTRDEIVYLARQAAAAVRAEEND